MKPTIKLVTCTALLAALVAPTGPTSAARAVGGCINNTKYTSIEPGFTSSEVRALANGSPVASNGNARTALHAYKTCLGDPGLIIVRFRKSEGVWRADDKRRLWGNGAPFRTAARQTLSLPAYGCLTPSDYKKIAYGWRVKRVEDLAGGPAVVVDGGGQPRPIRAFAVCASPGFVLIGASTSPEGRFVDGKRALFG